jgi:uncharacterized UBP type Zn finger protein
MNSSSPVVRDMRSGLSIEHVLREFLASETLPDYHCEHCKSPQQGTIYTSLHTLPDVLVLHLKRLVMNSTGGMKIRTLVKFPIDNLQMNPFTTAHFHSEREKECAREQSKTSGTQTSPTEDEDTSKVSTAEAPSVLTASDEVNSHSSYDLFAVVNHLGKCIL